MLVRRLSQTRKFMLLQEMRLEIGG